LWINLDRQLVVIPCTGDQPVARPLPAHDNTNTEHRHPCLEWDSNPQFQCSSGLKLLVPFTARSL
jgi:hypothetical protein